ncbi:capsular polysaccharide synthesis protein [Lactiplantibacillus songbeiensis]|uniref:Capsular polysaccharide synthesis protein n=1 Tax=Lactiplantibacillus songbeiensis TaxID=2559920 RepID=A0ABW4C4V0_9LACO|nr:capsular polysaccharide synthesis protein [Lactiplantibacillus songbeiensis]
MKKYTFHEFLRKALIYAYCAPLMLDRDEKNKLWRRKYRTSLKRYTLDLSKVHENKVNSSEEYVFTCWFQGYDQAPAIVKKCIDSIRRCFPNKDVVVITKKNMGKYIDIPDYILAKWKSGAMGDAHFSDILRILLLYKFGGWWLDATVMIFDQVPEFISDTSLFLFKSSFLDDSIPSISSWLIFVKKSQHPFIGGIRDSLLNYWRANDKNPDYYLFHDFVTVLADTPAYKEYWDGIPYYSNVGPHILQHELFQPYKYKRFTQIINVSSIQKLTYKLDGCDINDKRTNLYHILNGDSKYG